MFKSSDFKEESEWRIILVPFEMPDKKDGISFCGAPSKMKHRISAGRLIPYFTEGFGRNPEGELPITDIMLGPKNAFNESDLRVFLVLHDSWPTKISRSSVTYR